MTIAGVATARSPRINLKYATSAYLANDIVFPNIRTPHHKEKIRNRTHINFKQYVRLQIYWLSSSEDACPTSFSVKCWLPTRAPNKRRVCTLQAQYQVNRQGPYA